MLPLLKDTQLLNNNQPSKMIVVTEITSEHQSKLLFLLGSYVPEESKKLFCAGHQIYQLPFANSTIIKEQIKLLSVKNIDAIVIKKDAEGEYLKQIATIKNLKLNLVLPVILYCNEGADIADVKKYKVVDDLVHSLDHAEDLEFKISFLRKCKKLASTKTQLPGYLNNAGKKTNYILRRSLDILISSLILLILSPAFLLIAIAVKLESRGPIFYISKRAGRHYRIFKFYKFRTMEVNADKKLKDLSHLNQYNEKGSTQPNFLKIKNDPRITKVGALLRNTSLDELPQLINVLLGHMSLVGNRPLPLYEAATLTSDHWANRFDAPAGMTGLWQIMKRGEDNMSIEERIELDITYAKNNSLLVDLWIMVKTPFAMMQRTNV